MIAFGFTEQRPHKSVVLVNDFVVQHGHGIEYHWNHGRMAMVPGHADAAPSSAHLHGQV